MVGRSPAERRSTGGPAAPELDAKRLYLLHDTLPNGGRIGALTVNSARDAPNLAAVKDAAERAGVELIPFYGAQALDYPSAFARSGRWCRCALALDQAPVTVENYKPPLADRVRIKPAVADHLIEEFAHLRCTSEPQWPLAAPGRLNKRPVSAGLPVASPSFGG
jgi:hypothetical protein